MYRHVGVPCQDPFSVPREGILRYTTLAPRANRAPSGDHDGPASAWRKDFRAVIPILSTNLDGAEGGQVI